MIMKGNSISIEEYKTKFQRRKGAKKATERFSYVLPVQHTTSKCKFPLLKLVLLLIICGAALTLIYSPEVYDGHHLLKSGPHRWIWSRTDLRYSSQLDINWEDVAKVISEVNSGSKYKEIGRAHV